MTRRHLAASLLAAGVVLTSAGVYLHLGAGAALITAGGLLIVLALLLGWNA